MHPIIHILGESTHAVELAAARLRDGLALAYTTPPTVECYLADITHTPPEALAQYGDHGLTGPQAYRVRIADGRVWLLGHGSLGVAYAVEDFRRRCLRCDPLAYWTGVPVRATNPLLPPQDRMVPPPAFAQRIFFENDADELINWSGRRLQLEWPEWQALIDTLLALGYSGVEMSDSIGRSEFACWEYYQAEARYALDVPLITRVFNYLHDKGMLLFAQMSLAWPFRPLPAAHSCWSRYQDEWKAIWRYYLTDSPLALADILDVGICDPLWDGSYRCHCEMCAPRGHVAIQHEISQALAEIIREVAPDKQLGLNLYGRAAGEIAPDDPGRYVLENADKGYAVFDPPAGPPPSRPGAVYIHAGYWLDHTVQNPYLERVAQAVRLWHDRGATHWIRVNGQSFKPFMLMVDAIARAAWDPAGFDPAAFCREWAEEHLGPGTAEPFAAYCDALLAANEATRAESKERGYVALLIYHVYPLFRELSGDELPPSRDMVYCTDTRSVLRSCPDHGSSLPHAEAVHAATAAAVRAGEAVLAVAVEDAQRAAIEDQVVFPARLFHALAAVYLALARCREAATRGPVDASLSTAVFVATKTLWELHITGPAHPTWREWYLPNRQRIFGTPPTTDWALRVAHHLRVLGEKIPPIGDAVR